MALLQQNLLGPRCCFLHSNMPTVPSTVSTHDRLLHCISQKHQRVNFLGFSPIIASPAGTTLTLTTIRRRKVWSRWNNTNTSNNTHKPLDDDKCCSRAIRLKASSSFSKVVVVDVDGKQLQGRNPSHVSHSGAKIVDQTDGESQREETQKGVVLDSDDDDNPSYLMNDEERGEWRRKIRQVIDMNPDVEEEQDPVEKGKKMQKLLTDYPLVVEEEDPDWPEDEGDGWGFNMSQFFNKITIKNKKKDDGDDENYDSDKEIVWQDDDYIRAIKDITTNEWEETVFKDISPLIVLVHNRYKRPQENERARTELEKAVQIFWDSRLPSPRCVAVDAVTELDLVSALKVSVFPEILYTKAGKIIYRERVVRPADELSKIMAFFFYGASRPSWLKKEAGDCQEQIPTVLSNLL